jgi:2-methylisocitrate lyase-like PEP mutase family enzyme
MLVESVRSISRRLPHEPAIGCSAERTSLFLAFDDLDITTVQSVVATVEEQVGVLARPVLAEGLTGFGFKRKHGALQTAIREDPPRLRAA